MSRYARLKVADDAWIPPVAKRALNLLAETCDDLEDRNRDLAGAVRVLATALKDIEEIAQDNLDLGRDDLSNIIHICQAGGVRTAMGA